MTTETRDFLADQSLGIKLQGSVVTWSIKGIKGVPYQKIKDALAGAGLDPESAREVKPRNAGKKAINQMKKGKVISKLKEDHEKIFFQFTREEKAKGGADRFDYDYETILAVDKESAQVSCPDGGHDELVKTAQELVDEAVGFRDGGQISKIVQAVFRGQADLFAMNDAGVVYFVPVRHQEVQDKIANFLDAVGGHLTQMPVPRGIPEGDKNVKEVIDAGLQRLVRELRDATQAFDLTTREGTIAKQAQKIHEAKFKIESYREYVNDLLLGEVETADAELKHKVADLGNERENQKAQPGVEKDDWERATSNGPGEHADAPLEAQEVPF